ncbi:response regulator [Aquimarina agarilytica]|uniref:response regulator n=1 Tax=Aquimarina agarilytica TaxID=1087449 RepID=UPI00028A4001|nr:response regulator [Aquimarina agarilytica]
MNNSNQKKHVLIFEDDIDLASQWVRKFKKEGMVPCHAINIDEAVSYCNQMEFDAVVLDIFLVDEKGNFLPQGGLTLISYLRNSSLGKVPEWGKEVPVVIVTGAIVSGGFDPVSNIKSLGGSYKVDSLNKPFTPDELFETIEKVIKTEEH